MSNGTYESPSTDGRRHGPHPRVGGPFAAKRAFRLEQELQAALQGEAIQVEPTAFIPAAEQCGLIHPLGGMILKKACQTAHTWSGRGLEPLPVSVNVSVLQIDAAFGRLLEEILKECRFPAMQLELEITESALIANPERAIGYLNEWKELGVRIAIDDFGTGYSSLSYLTRLPVDRLKLDRSLVQRMTLDWKSVSIMRLILGVATELGLDIVAEGVETEQELRMLVDLGCPTVQGYLLARPVPARQLRRLLTKRWGNRCDSSVGRFMAGGKSHAV